LSAEVTVPSCVSVLSIRGTIYSINKQVGINIFPSEVLSIIYKIKFVSIFPRDSFPTSIMKDIKHYAATIL
jgi:hypothetical protein